MNRRRQHAHAATQGGGRADAARHCSRSAPSGRRHATLQPTRRSGDAARHATAHQATPRPADAVQIDSPPQRPTAAHAGQADKLQADRRTGSKRTGSSTIPHRQQDRPTISHSPTETGQRTPRPGPYDSPISSDSPPQRPAADTQRPQATQATQEAPRTAAAPYYYIYPVNPRRQHARTPATRPRQQPRRQCTDTEQIPDATQRTRKRVKKV